MSKKQTAAPTYEHVTDDLLSRVRAVIEEHEKHKYSVSKVYGAYNEAFKKRDMHQTCASCLRNRSRALATWLEAYEAGEVAGEPIFTEPEEVLTSGELSLYDALVSRLGLHIGTTAAEEMGAIEALQLEGAAEDYPHEVSRDEWDALKQRHIQLAAQEYGSRMTEDDYGNYKGQPTDEAGIEKIEAPDFDPVAKGATRYNMGAGFLPIDFTPSEDDVNKGTVLYADGTKPKAGTHVTADNVTLIVQAGGKARIEAEDLT